MLGIHEKHGYHAIVIYVKKDRNESKFIFKHYATPGFAEEYFGTDGKRTKAGEEQIDIIKKELESKDYMFSKGAIDSAQSNSEWNTKRDDYKGDDSMYSVCSVYKYFPIGSRNT